MFGFLKRSRSDIGRVEGFGKIPSQGDFVRTMAPSEELLAFESWLARAMERGEERRHDFKTAFQNGPAVAFVWSGTLESKKRGLLGGVILPSRDAVGRTFPIVIAAPLPLPMFEKQPHATAIALHDFFLQAADAAQRARLVSSATEFHMAVAMVHAPAASGKVDGYDAWAAQTRAGDLWRQLFGDDAERGSKWALSMLVESVRPYRGQDLPPLALGMRVPLGPDRRHTAAMWIDLVRHAAGWKTTVPSAFFPLGGAPTALIQLGAEAPASVLEDLYTPDDDSETVCDASPPPVSNSLPPSVSEPVARATADVGASISSLIAEIARA